MCDIHGNGFSCQIMGFQKGENRQRHCAPPVGRTQNDDIVCVKIADWGLQRRAIARFLFSLGLCGGLPVVCRIRINSFQFHGVSLYGLLDLLGDLPGVAAPRIIDNEGFFSRQVPRLRRWREKTAAVTP